METLLCPKRIPKLRQKPFRIIRHIHALLLRELIARQIKRSKHPINERKEYGVVFVVGCRVRRVMPMVKLRRRNDVLQPSKSPIHVCMNEHRVKRNHYDVDGKCCGRDAQQIDGDERHGARDEHVYEMGARTG